MLLFFWSCSFVEGTLNVPAGGIGVSGSIGNDQEIEPLARAESQ